MAKSKNCLFNFHLIKDYFLEKSIKEEHLAFDYKWRQNNFKKKNPIKILKLVAFPKEIVEEAKKLTLSFEKDKTVKNH